MPRNPTTPALRWRGPGVYLLRPANSIFVYVGSSSNVGVRCATHLRLLRQGCHPCSALQVLWNATPALGTEMVWYAPSVCTSEELRYAEQESIILHSPHVLNANAAYNGPVDGWEDRLEALMPDL